MENGAQACGPRRQRRARIVRDAPKNRQGSRARSSMSKNRIMRRVIRLSLRPRNIKARRGLDTDPPIPYALPPCRGPED